MAVIEARVIQKVATEAEWLANPLMLYQGECAFVSDKYNFKLNTQPTPKKFIDLEYYYQGDVLGSVGIGEEDSKPTGVYRAKTSGIIGGVVVKDGYYTLLRKKEDGSWVLESEVKMPMLSPTGKVEEGNTEAVSGGEVYNKIEVINDLIANFSGQIGSGIIGEALPETIPISEGFGIYTVSTAGTFVNFKDVNNTPLIVSQSDLDSGLVQLWGNNNIWEKHVTLVDVFTPVFSDNLSDI